MEERFSQNHVHKSTLISPKIKNLTQSYLENKNFDTNQFWREISQVQIPIIEAIEGDPDNFWVTFLVKNPQKNARMAIWSLNFGFSLKKLTFEHLFDTDIHYKCFKLPGTLRTTYNIINHPENPIEQNNPLIPDDVRENIGLYRFSYGVDPLNPHEYFHYGSILELPNAPSQQYCITREQVSNGKISKFYLKSAILNKKKQFWVYAPNVSDENLKDIAFICAFDGHSYQNEIPTPIILDNLIFEHKIPPTFALFLDNWGDREIDLPCNQKYAEYVAKELIPWIQSEFHFKINPQKSIIIGSSLGGLAACYFGLVNSDVFKNVIVQSGSFYNRHRLKSERPSDIDTWLIEQYRDHPYLGIQFYIENGNAENVGCSRHFRDVLIAKGYHVDYHEYEGGHESIRWRGTLVEGIISLIGMK
jgi:enterochelin esterase-like enzyme